MYIVLSNAAKCFPIPLKDSAALLYCSAITIVVAVATAPPIAPPNGPPTAIPIRANPTADPPPIT